jgi:protein-tyrosine phosphatase
MQQLLMNLSQPISSELYVALAERFGPQFVEAVQLLTSEENYPAVFHCTIGKDRTGILAALLLDILGVEDDIILEDYGLSNQAVARLRDRLLASPDLDDSYKARIDLTLAVEPAAIAEMLDTVRSRHGSTEGCFLSHGLEEDAVERLRKLLVEW